MGDDARGAVQDWVDRCIEYWSTFDPTATITEDMVDEQPQPPEEFMMDANAVMIEALAAVVEKSRSGSLNPTVESRLAVTELIEGGVERALGGMDKDARLKITAKLWDKILDQTDGDS